jgi:ankyrin repeat protein
MKKIKLLVLSGMILLKCDMHADDIDQAMVSQDLPHASTFDIQLPLHDIIKNQNYSLEEKMNLIKKLLDEGNIDINAQDADGKTALNLIAFYASDPALAQLLIDHGAKVNEPDMFNETPLHNAMSKENLILAAILLKNGADVGFKNDKDMTPVDLARSEKSMELLGFEKDIVQ